MLFCYLGTWVSIPVAILYHSQSVIYTNIRMLVQILATWAFAILGYLFAIFSFWLLFPPLFHFPHFTSPFFSSPLPPSLFSPFCLSLNFLSPLSPPSRYAILFPYVSGHILLSLCWCMHSHDEFYWTIWNVSSYDCTEALTVSTFNNYTYIAALILVSC